MKIEALRALSRDELNNKILECRRDQFNLRMQRSMGNLSKPHLFRQAKITIARIKTLLAQQNEAVS